MAENFSFDVVSDFDRQELVNALDQVKREVSQRYDLKGSDTDLELETENIFITTNSEIDSCVKSLARGGFYHAGQVCVSVQRIFLPINHLGSVTESGKPFVPQSPLDAPKLSRRDFMRLSAMAAGAGILLPAPPAAAR